jgi:oxygen-independent coproporphyrinogen III oxidase
MRSTAPSDDQPCGGDTPRFPAGHLYVHVPFCDGKCDYCGFYSIVADAATRRCYAPLPGLELQMLISQQTLPHGAKPETLYFGGGTPTMLGHEGVRVLVDGLRRVADLSAVQEWTVETNPASVTAELADVLITQGVNRVSVGAQCFDDKILRSIGRRHNASDVGQAVRALRAAGLSNIGLDLIAGLPGLTPENWRVSVDQALALDVVHVSVYALSIEPGTKLALRVSGGEETPDPDMQLRALDEAEDRLTSAGFIRYEISNYARPGWECCHNLACWRGADYVGLGPAAASRVGRQRWSNRPDLRAYMAAVETDEMPPREADTLDALTDATERFVFGLRLAEGVAPEAFAERYPAARERLDAWTETLTRLTVQGSVEPADGGGWRLTARGREIADAVIRELI